MPRRKIGERRVTELLSRLVWDAYDAEVDAVCASEIKLLSRKSLHCPRAFSCPLLNCAAQTAAPLTLAAFAARKDVNMYSLDTDGDTPIYSALVFGTAKPFLAAFTTYDVNAPCRNCGCAPLDAVVCSLTCDVTLVDVQALLDAGAQFSEKCKTCVPLPTSPELAALLTPCRAWDTGSRRAWMAACVSLQ